MSFIEYYYTSAALELFAALVTLVMLLGCFIINTHRTTVGIFLVALLAAHMLSLLIDSPIWILLAAPSPERVPLIKVLSFLPFSSYSTMFARIAMGTVAAWEIALSVIILIASIFGAGLLGAKIYRMGTLRYGNPISLSTALKDLKKSE